MNEVFFRELCVKAEAEAELLNVAFLLIWKIFIEFKSNNLSCHLHETGRSLKNTSSEKVIFRASSMRHLHACSRTRAVPFDPLGPLMLQTFPHWSNPA